MANTPRVSYKRAPSKELQGLLMPGGDLSWLVELGKREVAGYQHDVQFRGKEIHVYRDGARLIKAKWVSSYGKVELLADDRYMSEACIRGFFGRHNVADTMSKEFQEALKKYLGDVKELINARKQLGLTAKDISLVCGIRAVIGFGCNTRTVEVKCRYEKVLRIANQHLPSDVLPIETWAWSDNGPYPLSW